MSAMDPFAVSLSGINLVEASAGTGKTYNITSLYIRALIELDLTVGNILVVTYTKAATKELKDRLLTRMRESIAVLKTGETEDEDDDFLTDLLRHVEDRQQAVEKLQAAVRTFDESAVHTIHGFCYQALQEQAFESRALYDAEMVGDDSELVLEVVDDYWRNWVAQASDDPLKRPLLQFLLDSGYDPEALAAELAPHLGQPFLEIHPQNTRDLEHFKSDLKEFSDLYAEMGNCLQKEKKQIHMLLSADKINGNKYRSNSLPKWIRQMSDFLSSEVPPIKLFNDFYRFTTSALRESLNKGHTEPPEHRFFELAERYQILAESLQKFPIGFKKRLLLHLRDELQEKKEQQQVLSYDDMLLRLQEALRDESRGKKLADILRQQFPLALVDEFQDTDPSQYDIFRRIYAPDTEHSALFMIGDPKQSIYSFRGADVFSYRRARRDAPEDQVHGLNRNFRSVPKLISGINKLFDRHSKPFILDWIHFEPVKPGKKPEKYDLLTENGKKKTPIRFRRLSSDEKDQLNKGTAAEKAAEDTASEIYRLIREGKKENITIGSDPVEAKDIAVLVRTHQQAAQISDALRKRGIKSVEYSQESVFHSDEARQVEIFLKAVAEPADESNVKTALSLPLTGYKAHDLLDIEEDEEQWMEILDRFRRWHTQWQSQGFSTMFYSVIQEASISEHLMTFKNGERRLTNVLHLGELMQEEAQHHKKGPRGILKWLAQKRREEKVKQDEEQLRLESDEELVKIVTMHRSKGLEYPVVFCPFLWYGPQLSDSGQPLVYHDPGDPDKTYLDLNGKNDPDRDEKRLLVAREQLAESLRLAYVAMTRAKQCCYLTWAYATKSEFSPFGYLFLDPQEVFASLRKTITGSYSAIGSEIIEKGIQQLCDDYPELFAMETGETPESQQLDLLDAEEQPSLMHRDFQRLTPLEPSYQISSFSSLVSWIEADPDMPDYDQFLRADQEGIMQETETEPTIFNFPKGPQPGTCIHKIFEEIDFQDFSNSDEIITEQLTTYGIDERWRSVIDKMLRTVTKANLHPGDNELRLQKLSPKQLVPELEFYYQTGDITTGRLLSIIRNNYDPDTAGRGGARSGFLKGYIDLTFKFEGKYYLLDYKSNYLGDSPDDYRSEILEQEMRDANYDLQYHVYTVALHRFLAKRMAEYSYEKHFGGAFYLFVRGMRGNGREGIYFDRPGYSTIKKLDKYISRGENNG